MSICDVRHCPCCDYGDECCYCGTIPPDPFRPFDLDRRPSPQEQPDEAQP